MGRKFDVELMVKELFPKGRRRRGWSRKGEDDTNEKRRITVVREKG